ncbi:MAG TPA: M3 family oligoendopeptidase [Firmicutes bacterium]|nr:M3 family oligoendopeptidase [Bacillota bacterium]
MALLSQNWDLESIFPGGSKSQELLEKLAEAEEGIEDLAEYAAGLTPKLTKEQLGTLLAKMQKVMANLGQSGAFIGCLTAQNVKDEKARLLEGDLGRLRARLGAVLTHVDELLASVSAEDWQQLLADGDLEKYSFTLHERRQLARLKMAAEKEALVADLAVDGYHAWSRLYNTVVGRMAVKVERDGKMQELSVGQAVNLLANPDRSVRKNVFQKLEAAWEKEAELCAGALNHLAGFRLNLYKNRGWDDVLAEPLLVNRMERDTLEAMWDAVNWGKPHLLKYMARKAELLGLEKLAWYDVNAPLGDAAEDIR